MISLKCWTSTRKEKCTRVYSSSDSHHYIAVCCYRFLKCEVHDKKCTLVFYFKSKIKSIIYLTLDLMITNQREIYNEMINNLQRVHVSCSVKMFLFPSSFYLGYKRKAKSSNQIISNEYQFPKSANTFAYVTTEEAEILIFKRKQRKT